MKPNLKKKTKNNIIKSEIYEKKNKNTNINYLFYLIHEKQSMHLIIWDYWLTMFNKIYLWNDNI